MQESVKAPKVGEVASGVPSMLLIQLNRRALPNPIKIRGLRLGVMIWAVAAFGTLSVILVYTQIADLLGG